MSFSQTLLLAKLQEYIECKKERCLTPLEKNNCNLPFNSMLGLCSGLVALWLYHQRLDTQYEFTLMMQYIQNWHKSDFDGDDPIFEAALNDIGFLHFSDKLLEGLDQSHFSASMQVLAGKHDPLIAPAEFSITWTFDKHNLHELLAYLLQPNKMIRISDGLHVVGLIKIDKHFFYFDPFSELGPQPITNIEQLIENIFESLPLGRHTDNSIALHINSYDLQGSSTPAPIKAQDFYKDLLVDIHDPNIFHLAVRYSDYVVLNLLFKSGYQYIPWKFNNTCELSEVIERNDRRMLLYLIEHKIPLDYRAPEGINAVATAIWQNNLEMLYVLIQLNANIHAQAHDFRSLIEIACDANNTSAIILLLACGYNLSDHDQAIIDHKFGNRTSELYTKSLALQNVLLKIPQSLNLDNTSYKNIIALLLHCQLQQELLKNIDNLEIFYNNKPYRGNDIYKAIANYMHQQKNSNLYEFAETSQIYQLLDTLTTESPSSKQKELLGVLNSICETIIKKPLNKHADAEILEISVVLKNLDKLTNLQGKNKSELDVKKRAQWVKDYINKYLADQNVTTIEDYLQQKSPTLAARQHSMFYLSSRDWEPIDLGLEELRHYTAFKLN